MYRWACLPYLVLAVVASAAASHAQLVQIAPSQPVLPQPGQLQALPSIPAVNPVDFKAKAEKEKEERIRHQAALAMLDVVLAGARNLSLPQNRIAIASEAFPILWSRDEPRARNLVTQMAGDFGQAASRSTESADRNARVFLNQQWQVAIREIASADAELALSFMNATRQYAQLGNPEQDEAQERELRLQIAAQEASRNPRNAVRQAEKDLQSPGDLPLELINLLSQISAKDPEAGSQLLRDVVSRVRGADLSLGDQNFNFALTLLNSQANSAADGAAPDQSLKTLADALASAALSPQFPENSLSALQGVLPTLDQLAPSRMPALRQKMEQSMGADNSTQENANPVAEAQASGDPNQLLAVVDQASADVRPNIYQQVAWQLANSGELQQARQIADKLTDPFLRDQVIEQAVRTSASNAANQGQFATARQIVQELPSEEERATILAQFATSAAEAKQEKMAQEMLEEASGLLQNRPANSSVFAAQLQVAQAFAKVKPPRAVPMLERSASQLQQVLAAAAEMDGFLPYQRSFEEGELILTNGFLCNLLIRPYATAAAELASSDLPASRILADRLPLPEARLLAELFVVRSALGEPTPEAAGIGTGVRFVNY